MKFIYLLIKVRLGVIDVPIKRFAICRMTRDLYGVGYYGFQIFIGILSERLIGEINGTGYGALAGFEGNRIIRNAIDDGVKIIVAETADDLSYLNSMNSKALYMAGEGKGGSIFLNIFITK